MGRDAACKMILHGKCVDFGKVIKLIDDMVAVLHQINCIDGPWA